MDNLFDQIQHELQLWEHEPDTANNRELMVSNLICVYMRTAPDQRGDNLVPELADHLRRGQQSVLRLQGNNYLVPNYAWPSNGGFADKTCNILLRKEDLIDRIGDSDGMYVCPIIQGRVFTSNERSIPYYLSEYDITNESAYHVYKVVKDFDFLRDKVINAVNKAILNEYKAGSIDNTVTEMTADEYTTAPALPKAIIQGKIARCFGKEGNGTQIKLPLSIKHLLELEMIVEITKEPLDVIGAKEKTTMMKENNTLKQGEWFEESYSHIPYHWGCVHSKGIYTVYRVDERGVPDLYFRSSNEVEARKCLNIVLGTVEANSANERCTTNESVAKGVKRPIPTRAHGNKRKDKKNSKLHRPSTRKRFTSKPGEKMRYNK